MKIELHYFSGTGNTAEAAGIIAGVAEGDGHTVRLVSMERVQSGAGGPGETDASADLTVLLTPVYSWSPPAIVRRYLHALSPSGDPRRRMAIIAVDGGGGGGAANAARRLAERRGFEVFFTARLGYPVNWRQFAPVPGGETATRLRDEGNREAASLAREILAGTSRYYVPAKPILWMSVMSGLFFRLFGRRFLSQLFVADDRCTSCRLCERSCPVGAISLAHTKGARPVWKISCESCNRCINICPEKAIVTSWGRIGLAFSLIGLLLAGWFVASSRVFSALPEAGLIIHLLSALAGITIVHALALPLLPPLFRWIDRFPGVRRMMSRGFNGKWEQNIAPGFHPPRT